MAEGNGKPPATGPDEELDIAPRKASYATALHQVEGELTERLAALERHYADLNTALGQLRAYALGLGRQEDHTRITMERNIRAAAADLALKTLSEEQKTNTELLTTTAAAWLQWLKGGEQVVG